MYSFVGLGEDDVCSQNSGMMKGDPVKFYPRALKNLSVQAEIGTLSKF